MKTVRIIIIILGIIFGMSMLYYDDYVGEKIRSKYHLIDIEDSLTCVIDSIYWNKGKFLSSKNRHFRFKNSENYQYPDDLLFGSIFSIGDSLVKRRGSDTLWVYKNKKRYYFVLGRFINKTGE